jgi:O-antigen/teichoic acid export membrane protein
LAYQSTNQVYRLALLNTLPYVLYFLSVLVFPKAWISAGAILFLQQITILAVVLGLVWMARPRFGAIRKWGREIQKQHRGYGWPIYVGMLAGVATGYLNRLAIAYWVDNQAVGFYSLAVTLTDPLKLIPNAVGTSSFKEFANQRRISVKVTLATTVAAILAFVAAFIFLGEPLSWLYTKAFAAVSPMARAAALGAVLYGFGDFYNRFLGAHGKGAVLRNTAVMVGAVNALGFFIFVPLWGAWGAIAVNVAVGFVYPGVMYWSYRKYTKSLEAASGPLTLWSAD